MCVFGGQRIILGVSLNGFLSSSSYFLRWGLCFSLNLELSYSARLTDRPASPKGLPASTNYECALWFFDMDFGGSN